MRTLFVLCLFITLLLAVTGCAKLNPLNPKPLMEDNTDIDKYIDNYKILIITENQYSLNYSDNIISALTPISDSITISVIYTADKQTILSDLDNISSYKLLLIEEPTASLTDIEYMNLAQYARTGGSVIMTANSFSHDAQSDSYCAQLFGLKNFSRQQYHTGNFSCSSVDDSVLNGPSGEFAGVTISGISYNQYKVQPDTMTGAVMSVYFTNQNRQYVKVSYYYQGDGVCMFWNGQYYLYDWWEDSYEINKIFKNTVSWIMNDR